MDASIFDPVQGHGVAVKSSGEMKVEASVPGTVEVNIASTSDQIETTPGAASAVDWNQVDIDTTAGGTEILGVGARKGFVILNLDMIQTLYLGFGGGTTLSSTTGFPVRPGAVFSLPSGVSTGAQIKGISSSGTVRVAYAEFT